MSTLNGRALLPVEAHTASDTLTVSESVLEAFTLVTTVSAVLFIFVWSIILVSYLVFRVKRPAKHDVSTYRMPGGRITAWVVLAFFAFILVALVAVPVFGFFVTPLSARLSRKHEFEADAYAVAQTSGADLSAALLKLYNDNASTLTPDPVFVQFYYSHPPASERLARMAAT